MKIRILAVCLAVLMLLLSVPMLAMPAAAEEEAPTSIDDYIALAMALEPASEYQRAVRGDMLVEYATVKEEIASMTAEMQQEVVATLAETHAAYMYDYKYGEIESTPFVMTIAFLSDTHISNSNNTGNFKAALDDIRDYNPDTAGVFVLGDLSDNGMSPDTPADNELDNYYQFVKNYDYKNSQGEPIPITSILGNHDVRGSWAKKYPKGSYEAAVPFYMEQEGVDTLCFDKWINGYHFIMLNPCRQASDDCYLTPENLVWLDETLSENEDGRPIFVLVHQYAARVYVDGESPDTFEDVIARHPSAIVSSGHGHYGFTSAFVYQEGKGHYVNQPAMVGNTGEYTRCGFYIVDVYEGGAIFRARELGNDNWVTDADVVIPNEGGYKYEGVSSYVFYDENGATVASGTVADGSTLTAPNPPVKAADEQYTYTFAGWDVDGDGQADSLPATLNGNLSATAVYTAAGQQYTYIFYDADGTTELRNKTDAYGNAVRAPGVQNLFGWDLDGDGAAEALPERVAGDFTAVALLKDAAKKTYTFTDENGDMIQKGQAGAGEEIVAPTAAELAAHQPGDYFVGWDLDDDGAADELPTTITADLTAVAIYRKTSAVTQFWGGTTDAISYYLNIQSGRTILSAKDTTYAASPTGHAIQVKWDGQKEYTYAALMQLDMPLVEEAPTGYAIWIDAPSAKGGYSFHLYKGSKFSHLSGDGIKGDVYLVNANGAVSKVSLSGTVNLPAAFQGWLVIPNSTFGRFQKSAEKDVLKLMIGRSNSGTELQKEFFLGAGLSFTCTVDEMTEMLKNGLSSFYAADGSMIAASYAEGGKLVVPTAEQTYTDEKGTYTFAGWDLNGDGLADELPEGGAVIARAAYELAPAKYTYRFADAESGYVYYEKTADYGTIILPPPTTVEDATGTHTIKTLLDYEKGVLLTGDMTFMVEAETDGSALYTVKFVADGNTVSELQLAAGAAITAPAVPTKEGYTGKWEGYTEGMTATGNQTFTAVYTANGEAAGGSGSPLDGAACALMLLAVLATGACGRKRRAARKR